MPRTEAFAALGAEAEDVQWEAWATCGDMERIILSGNEFGSLNPRASQLEGMVRVVFPAL